MQREKKGKSDQTTCSISFHIKNIKINMAINPLHPTPAPEIYTDI